MNWVWNEITCIHSRTMHAVSCQATTATNTVCYSVYTHCIAAPLVVRVFTSVWWCDTFDYQTRCHSSSPSSSRGVHKCLLIWLILLNYPTWYPGPDTVNKRLPTCFSTANNQCCLSSTGWAYQLQQWPQGVWNPGTADALPKSGCQLQLPSRPPLERWLKDHLLLSEQERWVRGRRSWTPSLIFYWSFITCCTGSRYHYPDIALYSELWNSELTIISG